MFNPGVENRIGAQLSGTYIVTVNDWTGWQWETKITEQRGYPIEFSSSVGNRPVFCFS